MSYQLALLEFPFNLSRRLNQRTNNYQIIRPQPMRRPTFVEIINKKPNLSL
ncbi:hypothetical protein BDI4_700072 [Burkholderia diffusa]|nr:hypothetical protein BDI4_700072 [Burkholderia diffusa]